MFVISAVGVAFLVVFLVGAGVTWVVLQQIAKRNRRNLAPYRSESKEAKPHYLTEKRIKSISLVAVGLSIALMILSLSVIAREWFAVAWIAVTVSGILFGLFMFFTNEPTTKAQAGDENTPPTPARVPSPVKKDSYRELLARAWYDKELADRLIEYERKRTPYASFDELCRRAIVRWERDNR